MELSSGRTEHVLLAMAPGRDRELVEEWLDEVGSYDVWLGDEGIPEEYDVCLLDGAGFDRFRERLRERKASSDGFLPHLLLGADSDPDEVDTADGVGDALIDDVLERPLRRTGLARRIENLLATRRASLELAHREAQYRELVELSPEAVLVVDGGDIVYANTAAAELLDDAATELYGEDVTQFVDEADETALTALLEATPPAGDGASEFVDLTFRGTRGRRIDASVAAIRISYEGSDVVQLLVQDRTEANRREDRLRLFGRAVEAAAHGITIVDVRADDQPLIYANAGFTRITGYPLGEVLGRNCRFLQGENTDESTVDTIRAAIDAGEPESVEILNYRKDGTPFWNRLDIVPIRDEAGELTHYLGLQRDITDRVRNEQRLAVLDRILRHNVRNKTNVIRGYADAIVDDGVDPVAAAERIVAAAEELHTISEQVREFDTVVRKSEQMGDAIELDAVVGEGVASLREEFPTADVQFRASGSVAIQAHPTLRAAVQDLLYQLSDTERPVAEIAVVREGEDVRLDVRDRGGAIPREDLELVSTRSETPLDHLQGLELWLLRWAVEQSDGEFTVADTDGDPLLRMRFPAADRALRDS
ncbi:PAS domain-containing protein [Halolamina sp. C58]|uniref:PAS domain-containing protein n=1 Tax=Halolamina sp. C58 TaxID=3421640 RepID=UPI003EBE278D